MQELYLQYEESIAALFGWPLWIARTIIVLCTAISIVGVFQLDQLRQLNNLIANSSNPQENTWKFRQFQLSYLVVYLTIMLADWLQGTNMYTLYSVRKKVIGKYVSVEFC
jgi:hypothetical protein